jgi:hypothetical protein
MAEDPVRSFLANGWRAPHHDFDRRMVGRAVLDDRTDAAVRDQADVAGVDWIAAATDDHPPRGLVGTWLGRASDWAYLGAGFDGDDAAILLPICRSS